MKSIQINEANHKWLSKIKLDFNLKNMNKVITRIRETINKHKFREELK